MSVVVLDTNILLRLANPAAPEHELCRTAVTRLAESGDAPAVVPQVLVEFWVVATRPVDVNGLGWTPTFARSAVDAFLGQLHLLVETREAFDLWRTLVTDIGVRGKRAHDVRIAAVMLACGVTELLTLNATDFEGIPGLAARHPAS